MGEDGESPSTAQERKLDTLSAGWGGEDKWLLVMESSESERFRLSIRPILEVRKTVQDKLWLGNDNAQDAGFGTVVGTIDDGTPKLTGKKLCQGTLQARNG